MEKSLTKAQLLKILENSTPEEQKVMMVLVLSFSRPVTIPPECGITQAALLKALKGMKKNAQQPPHNEEELLCIAWLETQLQLLKA